MRYTRAYTNWSKAMRVLALLAVPLSFAYSGDASAWSIIFLIICTVLAKMIPIETAGGTELSLSSAMDITVALELGPVAPTVCLAGSLLAMLAGSGRQVPAERMPHHDRWSRDILAVAAAAYVGHYLGFRGVTSLAGFGTGLICGGVYMLVLQGLTSISDSIRYRINLLSAAALMPLRMTGWMLVQVLLGLFGVYALLLVRLTLVSIIGFAAFAMLIIYAARLYMDMRSTYWGTIFALIPAIENEFDFNVGHARRVSAYSLGMARKMVLSEPEATSIYVGAILHDIGMVGVDDQIVNKPSVLTVEEHAQVERHIDLGSGIMEKVPLLRWAHAVVTHHHERYDGTGYPDGLRGSAIPLGARIVAVADVFDALVSQRPHRPALAADEALAIMKKDAGLKFDPDVIDALALVVADEMRWGRDVLIEHYSVDFAR